MKTDFTPAPWCIEEANDQYAEILIGGATCTVDSLNEKGVSVISREEMLANACLISFAPELYAVLEEISEMDALAGTVGKIKIKMALAKARGEQ